jgi:hypothetical protein
VRRSVPAEAEGVGGRLNSADSARAPARPEAARRGLPQIRRLHPLCAGRAPAVRGTCSRPRRGAMLRHGVCTRCARMGVFMETTCARDARVYAYAMRTYTRTRRDVHVSGMYAYARDAHVYAHVYAHATRTRRAHIAYARDLRDAHVASVNAPLTQIRRTLHCTPRPTLYPKARYAARHPRRLHECAHLAQPIIASGACQRRISVAS